MRTRTTPETSERIRTTPETSERIRTTLETSEDFSPMKIEIELTHEQKAEDKGQGDRLTNAKKQ